MNFAEAEQYLYSFTDYEKTPGIAYTAANYDLRRMLLLLEPLGSPHLGTPTIHIAGTKGKGSTAAMIASILTTAGYKAGLFTSPHLHTIRERARIGNELISEAEFARLVTGIKPVVDRVNSQNSFGQLTTFEVLTAVVFTFFKRNHVDFQVLEVGLGGRLDATNIAHGDICIITSISLDHTEILGNTLVKIATEKAGIIKEESRVINFPQEKEVTAVIEKTCQQQGCHLIQLGREVTWKRTGGDIISQTATVKTALSDYTIELPLIGDFQLENAAAALAAVDELREQGANIDDSHMLQGIKNVNWPGRFQLLNNEPLVIADGAHNAYSMAKLIETIKQYFKYKRCFIIFGSSIDKDIKGMAAELAKFAGDIIITSSNHPRAASREKVTEIFRKTGISIREENTVVDAISNTLSATGKDDLIIITGSLFVVAEAIGYFNKQ